MDHRCPVCRANLEARKLGQAIVARMEMDCPQCRARIRLNVHGIETVIVLLNFSSLMALAAFGYFYPHQGLALTALGAAAAGMLALPVLENTCLREWPRYRPARDPASGA